MGSSSTGLVRACLLRAGIFIYWGSCAFGRWGARAQLLPRLRSGWLLVVASLTSACRSYGEWAQCCAPQPAPRLFPAQLLGNTVTEGTGGGVALYQDDDQETMQLEVGYEWDVGGGGEPLLGRVQQGDCVKGGKAHVSEQNEGA